MTYKELKQLQARLPNQRAVALYLRPEQQAIRAYLADRIDAAELEIRVGVALGVKPPAKPGGLSKWQTAEHPCHCDLQ